ncbi:Protein CrcB like protein [Tritrichomonas foetus]|uniref:Protein CrcB like protein n=1 Tax=Tritrichomonas foetus TaxID=1144522 RepID=A0A1J4KXM0_9EUKA|nr:Protein CrcB like protein [Tritrichomonas foetus]|eukprot:OHT15632.1 Protein CrcB like protein [Tritrichomonas foetus]
MLVIDFVFVIIGGFLGTISRHGIENSLNRDVHTNFMLGTFVVNILGCLIAGFLMPFSQFDGWMKYTISFLSVGFCGSLTTFGGYSYSDMLKLERPNSALLGLGDFLAMVVGCFLTVTCGYFFSLKLVFPKIEKLLKKDTSERNKNKHHEKDTENHDSYDNSDTNENCEAL